MGNLRKPQLQARIDAGNAFREKMQNSIFGNNKQQRVTQAKALKEKQLSPDRVPSSEENYLALNPLATLDEIQAYRVAKFRQDSRDANDAYARQQLAGDNALSLEAETGRTGGEIAGDIGAFSLKSAINTGAMVHGVTDFTMRNLNPVAHGARVLEGLYNLSQGNGFTARETGGLPGASNYAKANQIVNENFLSDTTKAQKKRVAVEESRRSSGQYDRVGEAIHNGDSELGAFLKEQASTIGNTIGNYFDNPQAAQDVAGESLFQLFGAGAAGQLSRAKTLSKIGSSSLLRTEGGKQALKSAGEKGALAYVGASEGASNAVAVKGEVESMSEKQLSNSPEYQKLRDQGMSHPEAREIMANEAHDFTLATNASFAMAISLVTGTSKLEGNFIGAKVLRDVGDKAKKIPIDTSSGNKLLAAANKVKDVGVSAVNKTGTGKLVTAAGSEAVEEGSQGYSGEIVSGVAKQDANPNYNSLETAPQAAGAGIVAGTLSSGIVASPGAITDIPKAIGKGVLGTAKGVAEVNKKIKHSKLEPEAKAAIKSGDVEVKGLIDKKPLAAAQVLLSPKSLEANKDKLPELLVKAQEQINKVTAVRDDLRNQSNELILEAKRIQKQVELTGNTPELTQRATEVKAEFDAIQKEIIERNKPIDELQSQLDLQNGIEKGKKAQEIDTIARKLVAVPNEETSDLDEDTNPTEQVDNTVTGGELRVLMGTDESVFNQDEEVLNAVEQHPEATPEMKAKIKQVREIKDAQGVSAEILNGNKEGKRPAKGEEYSIEYTGIIQHLENIVAAPNDSTVRNNYNRFRDHIKAKLVHARTMLDNINGKTVDPNALIAAQAYFEVSAKTTNKTLDDLDGGYFANLLKVLPKDLKRFAKADAFIANLDASPTASTAPGVTLTPGSGESQGTQQTTNPKVYTRKNPLTSNIKARIKKAGKAGKVLQGLLDKIGNPNLSPIEHLNAAFGTNQVKVDGKSVINKHQSSLVYKFYKEQGYEVTTPANADVVVPEIKKDGVVIQEASNEAPTESQNTQEINTESEFYQKGLDQKVISHASQALEQTILENNGEQARAEYRAGLEAANQASLNARKQEKTSTPDNVVQTRTDAKGREVVVTEKVTNKDGVNYTNYSAYRDGKRLSVTGKVQTKEEFDKEFQLTELEDPEALDEYTHIISTQKRVGKDGKIGLSVIGITKDGSKNKLELSVTPTQSKPKTKSPLDDIRGGGNIIEKVATFNQDEVSNLSDEDLIRIEKIYSSPAMANSNNKKLKDLIIGDGRENGIDFVRTELAKREIGKFADSKENERILNNKDHGLGDNVQIVDSFPDGRLAQTTKDKKTGKRVIQLIQITKDNMNEFIDYLSGRKGTTAEQKKEMFKYLDGITLEEFVAFFEGKPDLMMKFLVGHEQGHIDDKTLHEYFDEGESVEKNNINWLTPTKLFKEAEATVAGLEAVGYPTEVTAIIPKVEEQAPAQEETINIWSGSNENSELSNLAERPFTLNGRTYNSVEHAYQSLKSGTYDEATHKKKWKDGDKHVGKKGTKTDNNWNVKLMEKLIRFSFKQNPDAQQTLINTGDSTITHIGGKLDFWTKRFPELLTKIRSELQETQSTEETTTVEEESTSEITEEDFNTTDLRSSTNANPLIREARDAVRRALEALNFTWVDSKDSPDITDIERIASKLLLGKDNNDDAEFIKDAAHALSFAIYGSLGLPEASKATRRWVELSLREWLTTGKAPTVHKSAWVRVMEAYENLLSFFSSKEYEDITNKLEEGINNILTNNVSAFAAKKGYAKLNFQTSMDDNPRAVDVLVALQEAGINYTLTGSVAYADQVPVYRKKDAPLHDIDLLMSHEQIMQAKKILKGNDSNAFGDSVEMYSFNPGWRKGWKNILKNAGKTKRLVVGVAVVPNGYEIRNFSNGWTLNRTPWRKYEVYNKETGELAGSYDFLRGEYEIFKGVAGVTVDLMEDTTDRESLDQEYTDENGKKQTVRVASYVSGFVKKLELLRYKDINDFIGVVPPNTKLEEAPEPVSDETTQAEPEVVEEEKTQEEKIEEEIDDNSPPEGYYDNQDGNNEPPPLEQDDPGLGAQTVEVESAEDIDLEVKANVALKGNMDRVVKHLTKLYNLTDTAATRVRLYLGAKTKEEIKLRTDILEDVINGDLTSDKGLKPNEKKIFDAATKLVDKLGLDTLTESFLGALLQRDDLIHMPANENAGILEDIRNFLATKFKVKHTNSLVAKAANLFARPQLEAFKQAVADKLQAKSFDDLTEAQKQGAVIVWKFTNKFVKDYKTQRALAGIEPNLLSLHKQPVDYFSRLQNGKYVVDDNVIAALGLAGFEMISNSLEDMSFRKEEDLRSLLQIKEKDAIISDDARKLFSPAGSVLTEKARQVGQSFMNILGLDIQDDTLTSERSKMVLDAGQRVINTLVKMGVLEYMYMPIELYDAAIENPRDFHGTNVDMSQFIMTEEQLAKYMQAPAFGREFVRFVRGKTVIGEQGYKVLPERSKTFAQGLNDTDSMAYKIFGINNVATHPTFTKPEDPQTTINTGRSDVNPEAAEIVHVTSQSPINLNQGFLTLINKLTPTVFLDMVRTAVDDPSRVFNKTNEESSRSKIEQKERSLNSFFEFIARPEFISNPLSVFYIPLTFWSNSRVGEETTDITPQGDKIIRDLISYAAHTVTLKLTKNKDGSFDESNLIGLKYAIVQAMGEKVDKMNFTQISKAFDNIVKEVTRKSGTKEQMKTPRGYKALVALLDKDKPGKIAKQNISLVIDKDADEPLLKLHGLMALKQYLDAKENGGGDIVTDIHYEVDGITNGFAITLMQMFTEGAPIPYAEKGELLTQYLDSGGVIEYGGNTYDSNNIDELFSPKGALNELGHDVAYANMESLQEMEFLNKLERVGVYTELSEVQTAGDFATTQSNLDSYQNLARSLLNNLGKMRKFFNPKQKRQQSQLLQRLDMMNALMNVENLFGPNMTPYQRKEQFIKAINNGIFKRGKKTKSQKKLLDRFTKVLNVNNLPVSLLNDMSFVSPISAKIMVNTFVVKTPNQIFKERILAMGSFVGKMNDDNPKAKDNGLIDYAINKLGRDIAKPSLLISNYGASIANIVRTFSEDVTNRMVNRLAEIHKGLNSPEPAEVEAAKNDLAKLNKEINYIQGTRKDRVRFTKDNLLDTVDPKLIKSLQNHVTNTYGEALSHTLTERYGDMFKARSQLNAITGVTYELFKAYYDAEKKKYLDATGALALTKKQEREFDKSMEDLIPYYETYYSQEHKEGVLGPNTSFKSQQGNSAYDVASPIVKFDGKKGNINGYASEREFEHPSVRIAVMLTHAMDAAVQIKLMAYLAEIDDVFLNIHDAAGFAAKNPELYMQLYNKAFMEVMTEYSLPTAIMAPLQRVFKATQKDYPDEILRIQLEVDKATKAKKWGPSRDIGAFELNAPFQPLSIASMVGTAQAIVDRMNNKKLEFLKKYPKLSVTQYSISNTEGYKYDHSKNKKVHTRNKFGEDRIQHDEIDNTKTQEELIEEALEIDKAMPEVSKEIMRIDSIIENRHPDNLDIDGKSYAEWQALLAEAQWVLGEYQTRAFQIGRTLEEMGVTTNTANISSLSLLDTLVNDEDSDDSTTFNSTPDSDIDVDNFNADSVTELTEDNIVDVFDSLANIGTTSASNEHKATLTTVLESVAQVVETVQFHLREVGNKTSGAFASDLGIFVSAAQQGSTKPNFVARMSAQEAYVHELVHKVIRKALDTNFALRERAVRLREEVRNASGDNKFTFEIFMPPGMDDSHPDYRTEKKLAAEKLHYILWNEKTHPVTYINSKGQEVTDQMEDGLHEFMTYAVTNEALMEKLSALEVQNQKELNEFSTPFEKAVELFHKIMNYFNTIVRKKSGKANDIAFELFQELSGVHALNENKAKGPVSGLFDKTYNGYSKVFRKTLGKAARKGFDKLLPEDIPSKYVNPKNYWAGLNEVMKDTASIMGATHNNLIYQAFVEMNPRSKLNSFIHAGTRNKNKLIDKAIQKVTSNVLTYFKRLFQNPITKEQKASITRVILRLDLQSLLGVHDIDSIGQMLSSPTKLLSEIRRLESKITTDYKKNAKFYINMADNLGYMLRTGDQKDYATANNAWAIANLKDTNLVAYGDLIQAEKDIDMLASLYGLLGTGTKDVATVRDLITNEPEAMQNLMDIVRVNNEQRLRLAFDGNPAQMTKGYLKENYSHHLSYRIGTEDDAEMMRREGFHKTLELSNTLKDTSAAKVMYINKFQDLSTRTSGAFSLADNHSRGTAVPQEHLRNIEKHYKAALRRAAAGKKTPVKSGNNAATPVYDTKGNVSNFRYTINHHTKEAYLEVDMDFDYAIARLEGVTITKPRTDRLNKELLQAAFDQYGETDLAANAHKFVVISPKAKGILAEYWHMLPEQTQKDAKKIFGGNYIILPKDGLIMAMGAPNWSSQSITKRDINAADPAIKQALDNVNNVAALLLNNKAVNLTDSLLREGVAFAKDVIVVKSGIVLLGNETSNILTLQVEGLSFARAVGDSAEGVKLAKDYTITADKLMQVRIKLRTSKNLTQSQIDGLNRNANELRSRLRANPAAELIEAGMHQTLVEDVGDLDDNPNSMGRIEKSIKNNNIIRMLSEKSDNKYANAVRTVGSEVFMTHNSGLYRFLRDGTQLSDFSARYALHKFNLENGMAKSESIDYIEDTFIHYDLASHPFLQLGNDLGFLMFTKFFFRIQPIIIRQAIEHPERFALMLISQGFVGDLEDISDAIISLKHLISKFNSPLRLLLDLPETTLTGDFLLDSA